MPLVPGRFVFCERGHILDICKNVEGIFIEHTDAKLEGYQIYLVEQWAIERNREVSTTVSFTGDPVHKISVVTITIEQQDVYCPRLEKVFDKLREEKARPKETPHGQLFVTNLSLFKSSLNIVLVPQGDFDLYQRRFYRNLNLRRMGCSGRSALTSKPPSDAQREKFNQIYKISEVADFGETVIHLVDLVQNCLYIFGFFKLSDVDGLLCDATQKGLDEFYETFLSSKFQIFQSDNALDPGVLAGMFSKLLNMRGKLQHLVNNVPKDPFAEPVAFINAVRTFQSKKNDLKSCSVLDYKTIEAITAAYQSSFNPQGLKVHKVLKSKIEDFSGMTAVNAEGETTDLEVFAKHIHVDSLKLVWKGKTKHKPDMADALVNGDWLTGGKELGKSLVRGLAKTTRETKNASQSLKSMAAGKNRQSLQLAKGKGSPILNLKEGIMTDDTISIPAAADNSNPKSDDEKNDGKNDGDESDEATTLPVNLSSTINLHASEEEGPSTSTADMAPQISSTTTVPSLDTLASLFSLKPEPPGPPEIVAFYLDKRSLSNTGASSTRRRSHSLSRLGVQERLLGCRIEAAKNTGAIPGIASNTQRKVAKHPAFRKRTKSFSSLESKDARLRPLKSFVIACDLPNYYSYQLLKEKEETLKNLYEKLQAMEKEFSGQLESLKVILSERGKQFEDMELEAESIMTERRELLAEVRDKEHATQRSVYHLEGMVGKLIEIRDFTGAFFNKISYLDTKLPVSQRRLALWMDKLQALQSQWFSSIGHYMIVYAPSGVRTRFIEWERSVQQSAMTARELRGEVGEIQIGGVARSSGGSSSYPAPASSASSETTPSSSKAATCSGAKSGGGSSSSLVGIDGSASGSLGCSNSLLRKVGLFSLGALSSPSLVTPQALKTDDDDSVKDVRGFLRPSHEKFAGGEGGEDTYGMSDSDSPFPPTSALSSTSGASSSNRSGSRSGSESASGEVFSNLM